MWTEAGAQSELEEALGIGGFGYPAMAVVNTRKGKFSVLKGENFNNFCRVVVTRNVHAGPFTSDGLSEFLRDLSYGRGSTEPLRQSQLPNAKETSKWDGKDAEVRLLFVSTN